MITASRPRCFKALSAALTLMPALFASTQAMAAEPTCAFTYTHFETIVPHVDMETCPSTGVETESFCRAAVSQDQLHVFVFEAGGNQCLLKIISMEEDAFEIELKPSK